jgi:predicted RNase H-like HicB family nuclease
MLREAILGTLESLEQEGGPIPKDIPLAVEP